jgi:hypothetical protein
MAFAGHDIEEPSLPTNAAEIASMGWRELTVLAARLSLDASQDMPLIENDATTANVVPPTSSPSHASVKDGLKSVNGWSRS